MKKVQLLLTFFTAWTLDDLFVNLESEANEELNKTISKSLFER